MFVPAGAIHYDIQGCHFWVMVYPTQPLPSYQTRVAVRYRIVRSVQTDIECKDVAQVVTIIKTVTGEGYVNPGVDINRFIRVYVTDTWVIAKDFRDGDVREDMGYITKLRVTRHII